MKKYCISIAGSDVIGPYKIPQRGQNYISAAYASRNKLVIKSIVTDGVYGEKLNKLIYLLKKEKVEVIFTSFYQLLYVDKKNFTNRIGPYTLHFALENLITKNKKDLEKIFNEVNFFSKLKYINTDDFNSYNQIYKKYKIF